VIAGILDGIRVLEMGGHVSAPFCAKLFADYGADVIKIESPGVGDESRRAGPFVGDAPHPEKSIPFLYLNTNKRGITLDVENAAGRRIFESLLESTDVLVENFSPGDSAAPALDRDQLTQTYPGLIVTSITPFGRTGPYRDHAATDIVAYAMSGLMYHSGDSDREPLRNALDQSFYVAGINGAVATTAALFQRLFTSAGQSIDVSTMECLASHLVQAVPYYSYTGAIKGRRPIRGSGFEELMPAKDGYVIPSVQGSQPWETIADLIGLDELHDPRFASGSGRIEFGEELNELLVRGLAQWERKALHQASGERRLVFGMAQDAGDLFDCPQLRARDFFTSVTHPTAGTADYSGMGPKLSGMDYSVRRAAPLLGEHNMEIYCDELGYSDDQLVRLRATGAI
jgi:crotonobetainyl-CoA:carnitine CoA-transferase CaiB-like acyl-CoA transferase